MQRDDDAEVEGQASNYDQADSRPHRHPEDRGKAQVEEFQVRPPRSKHDPENREDAPGLTNRF